MPASTVAPVAITQQVVFGELVVTVRELTLNEITTWLADMAHPAETPLWERLLMGEVQARDLAAMTDWSREKLGGLTPCQLHYLAGVAKEVNALFFQACEQIAKLTAQATSPE